MSVWKPASPLETRLELGFLGGIREDEYLRPWDPGIQAFGDAIEVGDRVTGSWAFVPLAGPANRQDRIVASVAEWIPSMALPPVSEEAGVP